MDLSVLKPKRKELRSFFTISANKIETEIGTEEWDLKILTPLRKQLDDKCHRLENVQEKINDMILKTEDSEVKFEDEFLETKVYIERGLELITGIEEKLEKIIVFGVSASLFLLNATIMQLLNNYTEFPDVFQKLKCSSYFESCLTGVYNAAEAENFIERAELIMSESCFNLRVWESKVELRHTSKHSGNTSVLGIIWNLDEDTLKCKIDFEILSCGTKITKNKVVPIKSLSIPRMESMAFCIGARLVSSIIKVLDTSGIKVILWSNSTVALWWIEKHGIFGFRCKSRERD
ncbi:hypothetical protein HNY73_009474 [Argiope bruennichi]|uniref:Uncharacterized protein n=1 Tax=Argiope bruennichi TaxID=94029 RepID=A0A8T0F9R8_ARGBR|nr:hypothetical protein HNY73_009474 [Argiope bruennichi]